MRSLLTIALLAIIAFFLYRISGQLEPQLNIDDSRSAVIQKLQALQNIETAQMNLTKIIEWEQELTDYLPGFDRDDTVNDFLFKDVTRMEVNGNVTAWFDLRLFTWTAVIVNADDSITITLPQPEILHVSLNKDTKVYDKDLGILTKWQQDTETMMRNSALDILEQAALSWGILDEAETNALWVFNSLFGDSVIIKDITYLWN